MLLHKFFAAAIGALSSIAFVAADQNCCYWFRSVDEKFHLYVGWDAKTEQSACYTEGLVAQYCNVVVGVTRSTYLEATATAYFANGYFQWTFGMNNAQCKFLHNDQLALVATSTVPGLSENNGDNLQANGWCKYLPHPAKREIEAPKHPRDFSVGTTDLVVRDDTGDTPAILPVVIRYVTAAGVELLARVYLSMRDRQISAPRMNNAYVVQGDGSSILVNLRLLRNGVPYLLHGVIRMALANPQGWINLASHYLDQATLQVGNNPVENLNGVIVSADGDTSP